MSERMIELQRARLLAAGKGNKTGITVSSTGMTSQHLNGSQQRSIAAIPTLPKTPQQYAVATMRNEDMQMKRFLQRLQHERDDSQPGEASKGPTVPTALSRRMLHRQGAGYYDGTVAAITSAAADRFLATVLQQAVACRDQRLKGSELAKQSTRKRKRHRRQYQDSVDDRRRRKQERAAYREDVNLAAIAAADVLQQKSAASSRPEMSDTNKAEEGGSAAAAIASPSKSKKKKKTADVSVLNGYKERPTDLSDDEASFDSIDEEEEYYEQFYNDDDDDDGDSSDEGNNEEDDDETMILRDIIRPLEAWDYHMTGKLEINGSTTNLDDDATNSEGTTSEVDDVENDDDDGQLDDRNTQAMSTDVDIENGFSNDTSSAAKPSATTATSKKSPSKSPDDKKNSVSRISIDLQPPPMNGQGGATT